jgi:serine/threonine-protein kinase
VELDPLVGTRLGDRYEIVSVIGRGGMGVVYKARQEQMDKLMAIKMLHSHMVSDSEAVRRFYREAKTVSQVKHHHIVTLYDFGMSSQGQPFLVMDYLEGKTLKDVLKAGPLPFDRAERIVGQAIDALASAHSLNVVHRDLKPENIVLSTNGQNSDWVTLVDFGLSKLKEPKTQDAYQITRTGDVCGSPPYMSPEQCLASSAVDPRSDLYSLAIVIYECLSGKLPFTAKSAIEMMDCHLYQNPIPFHLATPELKVCSEISNVLSKAFSKEPEDRQADILEFGKEMQEAIQRDGIKLKTYKHRLENTSFKDLESEAEALASGTYPAVPDRMSTPVSQLANDVMNSIEAGDQDQTIQATGTHRVPPDNNRNWVSQVMSVVLGPRPQASQPEPSQLDTASMAALPYTNCPYCGATVRAMIKFCVSCQRQLPSAQEYAKMRSFAAGGKIETANSRNINATGAYNKPAFSNRAKDAMNHTPYPEIQKWLTILLVAVCVFALAQAFSNPDFRKSAQGIVRALTK